MEIQYPDLENSITYSLNAADYEWIVENSAIWNPCAQAVAVMQPFLHNIQIVPL